jgi:K+-sensing histidine kinase KdpD
MASHAYTNERWEQVIRLISHDLRNPLTAVKLSAQLIEQEASKAGHAKELRWATIIVRAAGRMDDMLQRLVEAERIRLGKIQLATEPVVLDELCREILAGGEPDLDGGRIQATLPKESVIVPADPKYIRQALLSLLRVALQEAGNALVAVEVQAEGQVARLWIRAPRPPEVPADAASSGSGDAGGRGSGQAIAQHVARTVIECHGGCLQITRGEDGSLTFALALPLA